jgi:hypothetical protein
MKRQLTKITLEYKEKTKNRLLKNINIDNKTECWNWVKYKQEGYGYIGFNKSIHLTHRVSYFIFIGPFDEKLKVCHRCDNPSCINPQHLFIGTQKDNVQDCIIKKRFNRQINIKKGEQNPACRISDAMVSEVFNKLKSGIKQCLIAKEYGIGDSSVSRIKRGYRSNKAEAP